MGASIYIADDEKNIRDLITKFLECDGYSVTAFETGDELMEEFLHKLVTGFKCGNAVTVTLKKLCNKVTNVLFIIRNIN